MSDLQRWSILTMHPWAQEAKDDQGKWVRYTDHAAEVARLKAELAEAEAKQQIDEQQCDDMTSMAADFAEENARLRPIVEAVATPGCIITPELQQAAEAARKETT